MTIESLFKNEFNVHRSDYLNTQSLDTLIISAQYQGLFLSKSDASQLKISLNNKTVKSIKFLHRLL